MRVAEPNPDEWWWGTASQLRTFCRDVMRMVEDVRDDEVLELRFNGRNFSPVRISKRTLTMAPERTGGRLRLPGQSPEQWWSGLTPGQRGFIQQLAEIVRQLERDRDKVLEIRHAGHFLTATLVLKFKRPTGWKADTN